MAPRQSGGAWCGYWTGLSEGWARTLAGITQLAARGRGKENKTPITTGRKTIRSKSTYMYLHVAVTASRIPFSSPGLSL